MRLFFILFAFALLALTCSKDKGYQVDCLTLDRVSATEIPPTGVKIDFRVLDCDGRPIRTLLEEEVTVINDLNSKPFGTEGHSGGFSAPIPPVNLSVYTVVMLDFSDSVYDANAVDAMIDTGVLLVERLVDAPTDQQKHKLAFYGFGATANSSWISDFSDDSAELISSLEALRTAPSRGGKNLYGAYQTALDKAEDSGDGASGIVDRFMFFITDGLHAAGDEESQEQKALDAKEDTSVIVFGIGLNGKYDKTKLSALTTSDRHFEIAEDAKDLGPTAWKLASVAYEQVNSNYSVGVCTPVELGSPTLTLKIETGGSTITETIEYSTNDLTGNVAQCNPTKIAGSIGGCPMNSSWPCACDQLLCRDGNPCITFFNLGDEGEFGVCAKSCDADTDCTSIFDATPNCNQLENTDTDNTTDDETTQCLLNCESIDECPTGQQCYAIKNENVCHP